MQILSVRYVKTFVSGVKRGTTQVAYKILNADEAARFQQAADDADEMRESGHGMFTISEFEILSTTEPPTRLRTVALS